MAGLLKTAQEMKQRRFSGARFAYNGQPFAACDLQPKVVENNNLRPARLVSLPKAFGPNRRLSVQTQNFRPSKSGGSFSIAFNS
jgi:hypothetical protein